MKFDLIQTSGGRAHASLFRIAVDVASEWLMSFGLMLSGFVLVDSRMVVAADDTPSVMPDFARDVRPILADFCFRCHGPDAKQRQADVRLDVRDEAIRPSKTNRTPIVPGKPEASEVMRRILADDDDVMPPRDSGQSLNAGQKEILRRWIAGRAAFAPHWAFVPPKTVGPPLVNPKLRDAATYNLLDRFVLNRLATAGLSPSPQADRTTLLRRVTLDLTGLPPTVDEVEQFLADDGPDAFERVVDRLLASPRYGEHMARDWLDAARYADTHGYFTDHERFMWRWRDWVIAAFNDNMPFDQFTVEQIAGDLLPNATIEQRIATGFNRNHMITEETGVFPEEYRTEYVADRVRTTSAVWMGLTAGCAQCHDHKYDPLTQREFYQLFAFFNQLPEKGIDGGKQKNAAPELQLPTPPSLMIMQDMEQPRDTFILVRGQYDAPGEKVVAGVPAFLPSLLKEAPRNRLGLARWLTDARHPLTSRVAVNRVWRQLFGRGLVTTVEDFGVQGELPSHPELLDWLAMEFNGIERRESSVDRQRAVKDSALPNSPLATSRSPLSWDLKRLQRLIVTSATYRQSSQITAEHRRLDPNNRLLARSPRYRLDAEAIRDSALLASGLLADRLGGPSVKPYQPADLWKHITYDTKSTQEYVQAKDDGLYRRSFYTYWKRQVPPPSMWQLDAPTRETCVLRRQRTNTPLQALVLMNDPQFIEAARVLAQDVLIGRKFVSAPPDADRDRVIAAFRRVVARRPTDVETVALLRLLTGERTRFRADADSAHALLSVGEASVPENADRVELAAWTVVCNTILNLDEALSRE